MSLIPAFQIGLWNAWIFILPFLLINYGLASLIAKDSALFIGVGIACASWIFLLIAMVFIILQHILVITEERMCLEKFGNEYREYMTKTPKWVGIPESGKSD